jgi:hypothetical protein
MKTKLIERAQAIGKRFSQEIGFYRLVLKHPLDAASQILLGERFAAEVQRLLILPRAP